MNDKCDFCDAPCSTKDKGLCTACQPVERAMIAEINAVSPKQERPVTA